MIASGTERTANPMNKSQALRRAKALAKKAGPNWIPTIHSEPRFSIPLLIHINDYYVRIKEMPKNNPDGKQLTEFRLSVPGVFEKTAYDLDILIGGMKEDVQQLTASASACAYKANKLTRLFL